MRNKKIDYDIYFFNVFNNEKNVFIENIIIKNVIIENVIIENNYNENYFVENAHHNIQINNLINFSYFIIN